MFEIILFGLSAALLWGAGDFCIKLVTDRVGYLRAMLYIQAVGGTLISLVVIGDVSRLFRYPAQTLEMVGIAGSIAIGTALLYKSFEVGRITIVSPVTSTYPAVSTVLAVVFLGEGMTAFRALGISVILAGVVLVSARRDTDGGGRLAVGVFYAVGALIAIGFAYFALKLVVGALGPWWPIFFFRFVTLSGVAPFAVLTRRLDLGRGKHLPVLVGLASLAALFDTLANASYNLGINLGDVSVVSTASAPYSAVTILLAGIVLKERMSIRQGLGVVAILAGVLVLGYTVG